MNENISPANIGGMGPISLPSGDAVGSGDVPAGSGDAKKKKKKKDKMLFSTFNEFVSERYRVDEAKIKDARKDLGYVAFLEEMAELNSKDLQKAYDAALEVLEDKGMSEKQAIGFLNSPHGKYMAEYVVPGMDYSHEAFLDKLEEYYNERMLKKYAKDYANLG